MIIWHMKNMSGDLLSQCTTQIYYQIEDMPSLLSLCIYCRIWATFLPQFSIVLHANYSLMAATNNKIVIANLCPLVLHQQRHCFQKMNEIGRFACKRARPTTKNINNPIWLMHWAQCSQAKAVYCPSYSMYSKPLFVFHFV